MNQNSLIYLLILQDAAVIGIWVSKTERCQWITITHLCGKCDIQTSIETITAKNFKIQTLRHGLKFIAQNYRCTYM